ncbi:MAG: hypothetical protein JWO56_1403 [Acidobacteria bacterium]|nr:hypothetical protein [Acidobacteriota bacterium]
MSKNNNVNPNYYKDGGREHTDGADKGDTLDEQRIAQAKHDLKQSQEQQVATEKQKKR